MRAAGRSAGRCAPAAFPSRRTTPPTGPPAPAVRRAGPMGRKGRVGRRLHARRYPRARPRPRLLRPFHSATPLDPPLYEKKRRSRGRRSAAGGKRRSRREGVPQTTRRSPADPGRPGASAHGTGFVATAGVLVGDIAQTPHAAPAGSGSGRPRSSGRDRFGARSAPPPRRPPPAALPEQPRRARPIPRGPTHRGGRAVAWEGLDGGDSSHRYGDDRHDARLLQDGPAPVVRRRSRPALRCGSCAKTPGEGGRTPEPAPAPEGQATGQPRDVVAGMLPTCDVASALRA